jgi:alkanesulfonate monooxygenase SsuD/methylene tetrahydromethanopterin reductase-like flavin-dependent oxidoreductase (luciferase family)
MVNFDPAWSYPKPTQRPHPPILLGGETDHTLKRVVEFCDGWFPRTRAGFEPDEAVGRLRRAAEQAGRDFSTLSITVFGAPPKEDVLAGYAKAGIDGALFGIPDASRDEILHQLDKWAPLAVARH